MPRLVCAFSLLRCAFERRVTFEFFMVEDFPAGRNFELKKAGGGYWRGIESASCRAVTAGIVDAILVDDSPDGGSIDAGMLLGLEVADTQIAHRLDALE